jgi:hypothetical protein
MTKKEAYRAGKWRVPVPPVCTGGCNEEWWIKYIDECHKASTPGGWMVPVKEGDTTEGSYDDWFAAYLEDTQRGKDVRVTPRTTDENGEALERVKTPRVNLWKPHRVRLASQQRWDVVWPSGAWVAANYAALRS